MSTLEMILIMMMMMMLMLMLESLGVSDADDLVKNGKHEMTTMMLY